VQNRQRIITITSCVHSVINKKTRTTMCIAARQTGQQETISATHSAQLSKPACPYGTSEKPSRGARHTSQQSSVAAATVSGDSDDSDVVASDASYVSSKAHSTPSFFHFHIFHPSFGATFSTPAFSAPPLWSNMYQSKMYFGWQSISAVT